MFETANYIEAGLWAVIGIAFLIVAVRQPASRGRHMLLAVTFAAFGGSDVVEVQTGAWWRPWWLFIWKAACVLIFLWQLIEHLRRTKRNES